ncbi:MAG: NADH-quinone oxidoreductase subunit J [Chloroflexota bacterium]|nr:MAG: NADH-quinone oxidoreductase subunit J [Chloroflexota bacterium]
MDYGALMEGIVFYLFAALAVLAALGVVIARSPIRAALSLALVFLALAAMYILLNAPFLAVAQIMIYAGAVLILFLFVIMVLNPRLDIVGGRNHAQTIAAVIFAVALGVLMIAAFVAGQPAPALGQFTPEFVSQVGHVQIIGALLFSDYLLLFEIASVLLLVAIVGAMTLARRERDQHANAKHDLR